MSVGEAFQYIFYPNDHLWDGSGCGLMPVAHLTLHHGFAVDGWVGDM